MSLQVYNSLSRKKEPFEPLEAGRVRMYVCGPTVYDKAHVGHAMSSIVFDVIRRYLEHKGFRVEHVMNYTDVEDKVIERANKLGLEPMELAERYLLEYEEHLRALNVLPATRNPRASREMDTIKEMVGKLIERDCAYQVDGDVYFRVSGDQDYGKLSGRRLEDMRAGLRLEVDERKEDPADFTLWKQSKPGEPAWDSPWGRGRPGWHIECSAMNLRYLGEQIDIHGGGNDLVFPHHENEIAQTESVTGKPMARYWTHNGMLQLRGEKMSKSLGNLVSVEEFLEHHEADAFRMLVLNSTYRSPLTFDDDVVEQAERALERMRGALKAAVPVANPPNQIETGLGEKAEEVRRAFVAAMDDDFNTPGALSQLFELVRTINQARDAGASAESLEAAQTTLQELAGILGLRLASKSERAGDVEGFVELLIDVRRELRNAKQWALADLVRERLWELGVSLEDNKDGTTWRFK